MHNVKTVGDTVEFIFTLKWRKLTQESPIRNENPKVMSETKSARKLTSEVSKNTCDIKSREGKVPVAPEKVMISTAAELTQDSLSLAKIGHDSSCDDASTGANNKTVKKSEQRKYAKPSKKQTDANSGNLGTKICSTNITKDNETEKDMACGSPPCTTTVRLQDNNAADTCELSESSINKKQTLDTPSLTKGESKTGKGKKRKGFVSNENGNKKKKKKANKKSKDEDAKKKPTAKNDVNNENDLNAETSLDKDISNNQDIASKKVDKTGTEADDLVMLLKQEASKTDNPTLVNKILAVALETLKKTQVKSISKENVQCSTNTVIEPPENSNFNYDLTVKIKPELYEQGPPSLGSPASSIKSVDSEGSITDLNGTKRNKKSYYKLPHGHEDGSKCVGTSCSRVACMLEQVPAISSPSGSVGCDCGEGFPQVHQDGTACKQIRRDNPSSAYYNVPHRHSDGTHCVTECKRLIERERKRKLLELQQRVEKQRQQVAYDIPWELKTIDVPSYKGVHSESILKPVDPRIKQDRVCNEDVAGTTGLGKKQNQIKEALQLFKESLNKNVRHGIFSGISTSTVPDNEPPLPEEPPLPAEEPLKALTLPPLPSDEPSPVSLIPDLRSSVDINDPRIAIPLPSHEPSQVPLFPDLRSSVDINDPRIAFPLPSNEPSPVPLFPDQRPSVDINDPRIAFPFNNNNEGNVPDQWSFKIKKTDDKPATYSPLQGGQLAFSGNEQPETSTYSPLQGGQFAFSGNEQPETLTYSPLQGGQFAFSGNEQPETSSKSSCFVTTDSPESPDGFGIGPGLNPFQNPVISPALNSLSKQDEEYILNYATGYAFALFGNKMASGDRFPSNAFRSNVTSVDNHGIASEIHRSAMIHDSTEKSVPQLEEDLRNSRNAYDTNSRVDSHQQSADDDRQNAYSFQFRSGEDNPLSGTLNVQNDNCETIDMDIDLTVSQSSCKKPNTLSSNVENTSALADYSSHSEPIDNAPSTKERDAWGVVIEDWRTKPNGSSSNEVAQCNGHVGESFKIPKKQKRPNKSGPRPLHFDFENFKKIESVPKCNFVAPGVPAGIAAIYKQIDEKFENRYAPFGCMSYATGPMGLGFLLSTVSKETLDEHNKRKVHNDSTRNSKFREGRNCREWRDDRNRRSDSDHNGYDISQRRGRSHWEESDDSDVYRRNKGRGDSSRERQSSRERYWSPRRKKNNDDSGDCRSPKNHMIKGRESSSDSTGKSPMRRTHKNSSSMEHVKDPRDRSKAVRGLENVSGSLHKKGGAVSSHKKTDRNTDDPKTAIIQQQKNKSLVGAMSRRKMQQVKKKSAINQSLNNPIKPFSHETVGGTSTPVRDESGSVSSDPVSAAYAKLPKQKRSAKRLTTDKVDKMSSTSASSGSEEEHKNKLLGETDNVDILDTSDSTIDEISLLRISCTKQSGEGISNISSGNDDDLESSKIGFVKAKLPKQQKASRPNVSSVVFALPTTSSGDAPVENENVVIKEKGVKRVLSGTTVTVSRSTVTVPHNTTRHANKRRSYDGFTHYRPDVEKRRMLSPSFNKRGRSNGRNKGNIERRYPMNRSVERNTEHPKLYDKFEDKHIVGNHMRDMEAHNSQNYDNFHRELGPRRWQRRGGHARY